MESLTQLLLTFCYHVLKFDIEVKPKSSLYARWIILSRGKVLDFSKNEYRIYFPSKGNSYPVHV